MIETTPAFSGLLKLQIGWDNEQPVSVEFNRYTNNYLAVTSKPGSGKTQFVKDLLAQIRRQSDFQANFIFFDYAKGDVMNDADFIEAARAEVVSLPDESLPLNPFARINVNSETSVKVAAQEFADLMESVEKRLGIVQKRRMNDAILSGFDTMSGSTSPSPDFEIIRQEIDTQSSFKTIGN